MTRALTRTNFHSSRLVRLLSDLTVLVPVEPGMAFAEKFSQWMPLSDAITLRAAHNASPAGPAAGTPLAARAALGEAFTRMRALWEKGITQPDVPAPLLGEPLDVRAVYEPYRRYYLAHQRDMELQLRPWRTKVRNELAKASPALRQLAALDAALDGILAARESKLFTTIPALLEKRFAQLHKAHQQRLVDTDQTDHPDFWMKPGGWLARFGHELQTVLLAELDLRLQPTQGLLEAFHNEKTQ
ncbi:MAG: DUF3348 domain-containing protein [Pseudomonadota bacterium]